jgi:hypothetical protein
VPGPLVQIGDPWRHASAGSLVFGGEERHVKRRVVRNEHPSAEHRREMRLDVSKGGLARQLDATCLQPTAWPRVEKGRPPFSYGVLIEDGGSDPDHAIAVWDRPSCSVSTTT